MSDQKELAKIQKFAEKKKTAGIIKMMGKADSDVLVAALEALGIIGDEDSFNQRNKSINSIYIHRVWNIMWL